MSEHAAVLLLLISLEIVIHEFNTIHVLRSLLNKI